MSELSDDVIAFLTEGTRTARPTATRYLGADRAEEFGRRNGVPGELVVRVRPTKVNAAFDVAE